MTKREIDQKYEAQYAQDGAGVKLRRLFWREDTLDIDPFLLLDLFDSTNPNDYIKGFPFHPHRGIQTLTYLIEGKINHQDSMGNEDTIKDGEFQWMNAGSGILHEEMPQATGHMMGFQLWINLPSNKKMSKPGYYSGTVDNIPVINKENFSINLISGEYDGVVARSVPSYIETEIMDIRINKNTIINIPVNKDYNVFITPFIGDVYIDGEELKEKWGAVLVDGDTIEIETGDSDAQVFLFAGEKLNEPVAWGGPIVMNTKAELNKAIKELREGNFIKDK